jgi:hypothetical protein
LREPAVAAESGAGRLADADRAWANKGEHSMSTMSWSVTLQVSGNPAVSVSRPSIDIEAVDRTEVTIAPGDTDKVVEIQPSAAGALYLLLIKSSSYGPHLTFKANDGTTDSASAVVLDSPQLFSGGSIALFGVAPRRLKFSNSSTDKPGTLEIYVARDATP